MEYIRTKVSRIDAPRYRGRKEYPMQNILTAYDFDMKFTYVLPRWEGTISDSRIIKNTLVGDDKLIILRGNIKKLPQSINYAYYYYFLASKA